MMKTAKIFQNGQSQAVRLPREYRLQGTEVSITRLGTGIVLQPLFQTWNNVFQALREISSNDILLDREDLEPQERKLFE
jgi:antitoxin VapB